MSDRYCPDWVRVSTMLRETMEYYRDQRYCSSLQNVIHDLITYIGYHTGKWLNTKTVKRDISNRDERKKLFRIPNWRIAAYARWCYEEAHRELEWIAEWMKQAAYPSPGELLATLGNTHADIPTVCRTGTTRLPSLKSQIWPRFWGRLRELERLRNWADQRHYSIAVLYGFGGIGKTTIQIKFSEECVHGITCRLRWPFDGVVWISAEKYSGSHPTLQEVLYEIADTFELPSPQNQSDLEREAVSQEAFKQALVSLLEQHRILVFLDSVETVAPSNTGEIVQFFSRLRGKSQMLMSTRYHPTWLWPRPVLKIPVLLIQVDALSDEDARGLVQNYLDTRPCLSNAINSPAIAQLLEVTGKNPKAMLAVLHLAEQGRSLSALLGAIRDGTPDADDIYATIVDNTWTELLTPADKATLMAKAFFPHSVSDVDLGLVAGIDASLLGTACTMLAAISLFGISHSAPRRISTHPLAQSLAQRMLREHPDFTREMDERWWNHYVPKVLSHAKQMTDETVSSELHDDIANVAGRLESHLHSSLKRTNIESTTRKLPSGINSLTGFAKGRG